MAFTLPDLSFTYESLEPHIDARTMEIHHQNHHGTYVKNLNAAIEGHPDMERMDIEEMLANLPRNYLGCAGKIERIVFRVCGYPYLTVRAIEFAVPETAAFPPEQNTDSRPVCNCATYFRCRHFGGLHRPANAPIANRGTIDKTTA